MKLTSRRSGVDLRKIVGPLQKERYYIDKALRRYEGLADAHRGTAGLADHAEHCDLCFFVCLVEQMGGYDAIATAYGITDGELR